ncbi:type IV toxin-antitoxin system AbiEi family antitoxin domain-containing protein [uncultured Microbacterium sp.]|uniref:type IV toxin-antitoxin system AbiEi family antitoxin domain-containing protein n=1 Tax=uncultured Microbacterium sp. TaxID=191216 RepID=UPI0028DCB756|nr:type IV toxin-antitoxin system AbiEi family antitoxin domain-containing protein [uncultured Microbacterium sp.]
MSFLRASAALASLGRMARTAELRSRGVTAAELSRAVREGEILRPRQGVYALVDTDPLLLHAAEHGGTIGCADAGERIGLWILQRPRRPHVWMGSAGTPRLECDSCTVHWDAGRVRVGQAPPVANILLQMASCCGEDAFFAALESALRRSLLSAAGARWLQRHLPVSMRWLVAFARADSDSGLESLIRLRLHRIGIDVRSQVHVPGVGEIDLVIGDRLLIEADGRENHERERERAKDLRRDAAAASFGYTTLRFTYAMVVADWPLVEAAITGAMARGAHLA